MNTLPPNQSPPVATAPVDLGEFRDDCDLVEIEKAEPPLTSYDCDDFDDLFIDRWEVGQ